MKYYIAERYTLVVEECAEVIQSITKILRHGEESYNPVTNKNNIDALLKELIDLQVVISMLKQHLESYSINTDKLRDLQKSKLQALSIYVHNEENKRYLENELKLLGDS